MYELVNLWTETLNYLKQYNLSEEDIEYIQWDDKYCFVGDFLKMASTFNYYKSDGTVYVNPGLKIVGNGWWLERCYNNCVEGWEMKTYPTKPNTYKSDLEIHSGYKLYTSSK